MTEIVMKPEYEWMSVEAIVEEFDTEQLRSIYAEIYDIRNLRIRTSGRGEVKTPILERLIKTIEITFGSSMRDPLSHLDLIVTGEILFRFRENKL